MPTSVPVSLCSQSRPRPSANIPNFVVLTKVPKKEQLQCAFRSWTKATSADLVQPKRI